MEHVGLDQVRRCELNAFYGTMQYVRTAAIYKASTRELEESLYAQNMLECLAKPQ